MIPEPDFRLEVAVDAASASAGPSKKDFDSRMMGFAWKQHFVLLALEERNRNRQVKHIET